MPAKLYGDPVRAIQMTVMKVQTAVAQAVDTTAESTRKKFELAVRQWKNKPRFIRRRKSADKGVISSEVVGQGSPKVLAIFGYVDEGTEAHLIFPKKPGGKLRFQTGYSARTSPVANPNSGTGEASGKTVFSKGVMHPGTEAREFTGFYALEAQEQLTAEIKTRLRAIGSRKAKI